jgi:signal transduction histidine kinase
LLTLARLDPDHSITMQRLCLRSLLSDALADTCHLADERGLTVAVDAQEVYIMGSEESLMILLCNLLINAFRYASDGSTVELRLRVDNEAVVLEIANDCAALSKQEFARICERFYRAPGAAGQGAGLGLSIVARIAEQHGASMSVGPEDDNRGFRVRLEFPVAGAGGADVQCNGA